MHESAVIGGLLFHTSDPVFAAQILESFLASSVDCENELRACGIDPAMAAALRIVLPKDKASIHVACAQGAAWVLGFRSAPQADSWQLVATVPVGMALPAGVRRATAETIISIVTSAQKPSESPRLTSISLVWSFCPMVSLQQLYGVSPWNYSKRATGDLVSRRRDFFKRSYLHSVMFASCEYHM